MKTSPLTVFAVLAVTATAALAQETSTPPAPTTPPPVVAKPTPAPEPVTIDGYVNVDALPSPTQLAVEAERENLVIKRMDKSADRIVVVYQYPDGRTRAFAYTLTGMPQQAVIARPSTPAPTVIYAEDPAPPTTVIYREPETVYIYDRPRYYEPVRDFWAPFTVGVGLGWGFGHSHHYHGHGHFRGHWRR